MLHLHYRVISTLPEAVQGQSRSFTLRYPHHGNGAITLTAGGVYNLTLNSWDTSDASARRTNEFKDALFNVSNDLVKAYENNAAIYTNIHGKMIKLHRKSYYEGKLPKVELQSYKRKTFGFYPPTKAEVKGDLENEANKKYYGSSDKSQKSTFVDSNIEKLYADRMEKWNEAKSLFDEIENAHEQRENAAFSEKYNSEIQAQKDYMEGSEYMVKDAIDSRMANISLPYTINVDMAYIQDSHLIDIEVELISGVTIPQMKATLLASGKVSVKEKLVREIEEEKTISMLGVIYHIASVAFDASPNIDNVRISLWDSQKQNGLAWINFPRKDILHNTNQQFVPTMDSFNYERVMNLKDSRGVLVLAPIKGSIFKKQVNEIAGKIF